MNNILNIWRKELMDSLRDRKALTQALLTPLIIGVFYAVMNPLLSASIGERARAPITIPTQGIEHAGAAFTAVLEQFDITLEPYDGDLSALVASGEAGAGLIIPPGFAENIDGEQQTGLMLLTNATSGGLFGGGFAGGERLDLAISAFNAQTSANRVSERELDPALLTPISLEVENLATDEQRAGVFASFTLPLLLIIVVFIGGLFIAIDVTAGEKERGTLEALLVTPATDNQILIGKVLAVFTLSVVPFILTLVAFWAGNNLLPESVSQGARLPLSVILVALITGVPLSLFMGIILMVISVRTKTFKDAQSAASSLNLAGLVPAFAAAFVQPQNVLAYLIPFYGPAALVSQTAISGGVFPADALIASIAGSLIAAAVAFVVLRQRFDREKLLFAA
ncbi:MAG: ABC transporter permease [bacterium]|nr:ABC transporter permease [bacterium]